MQWKNAEGTEGGAIKVPDQWLHLYYYEALNILFRFENALRIFAYSILKNELGEKWDLAAIGDGITIRTETKKRIAQSREHGYLGYEVSSEMLYLNSGELIQIITSEAYWRHFAPYFKATKAIVLTKLQEIGTVRNSLAHFRPIKQDDIDLIKQNSKHVLLEIETCLVQLTSISQVVPSNWEASWYKEIKSIGGEGFSIALYISKDQDWVRLELSYKIPVLQRQQYGDSYMTFKVGNFATSSPLKSYKHIKENCIYISENPVYLILNDQKSINDTKDVSIVFSKTRLEANLANIVSELKDIAIKVDAENSLISQDNLAQGQIIESQNISATIREYSGGKYWSVESSPLLTDISEIDDVEFWGVRHHYENDFISSTAHYPWMPSSVSRGPQPF